MTHTMLDDGPAGESQSALIDNAPPLDDVAAWRAVVQRDRSADGRFVTAVLTTGICCRPSCPARTPARRNVRFYASVAAALAAGFRACLRCRPGDVARDEAAVSCAIEMIRAADAEAEPPPPLAALAAATGYSPAHFQRLFTRDVGLSPAALGRALRRERVGELLSEGGAVTDAIYAAGYGASSRFYVAVAGRMGMAPSVWAKGGEGVTIRWAVVPTDLGPMLVAASDKGVCRLAFGEGKAELEARFPGATLLAGDAAFGALLADVVAAVAAPGKAAAIPLDVRGTVFQEKIWAALREIPFGETRSYAALAAAAGHPRAVRAAGSANGANPVAVLIPCHRVVRSDGAIGGYAYGPEIKRRLLERERS